MIRIRLRYGDCRVEVVTDAELHPDILDEMTARAVRLFADAHATLLTVLPDEAEGDDA